MQNPRSKRACRPANDPVSGALVRRKQDQVTLNLVTSEVWVLPSLGLVAASEQWRSNGRVADTVTSGRKRNLPRNILGVLLNLVGEALMLGAGDRAAA